MPTSTALRMARSSMKVKILVLHSWTMLRSSLLKSKSILRWHSTSNEAFIIRTDYIWAKAMGYTGQQLDDSAGVSVGESSKWKIGTMHWCNDENIYLLLRNFLQADRWVQVPGWSLQTLQADWWGSRHRAKSPCCPDCYQGDGPGGVRGDHDKQKAL